MPTDRIPCRTDGCANTILPATAKRTDGYCMPCVQQQERAKHEEYIRKNRREVDPYAGITDPVEIIRILHTPRRPDALILYRPPPRSVAELYSELSTRQAEQLMVLAAQATRDGKSDFASDIARSLAIFTDYPLDSMLVAWMERNQFAQPVIFRGAGAAIRDGIIKNLNHGNANANHALSALAWIGDATVQAWFHEWEIHPAKWSNRLHVGPMEYAHVAGWEMGASGRRDLFHHECWAVSVADSSHAPDSTLHAMREVDQVCPRCKRQLIHLVELDLADNRFSFLGFSGKKLPILTCDACTCFVGHLYARIDADGIARWADQNELFVQEGHEVEDWGRSPWAGQPLRLCSRRAIQGMDMDFGTTISQIGGMPSWVQDSYYPRCLDCSKTMMFIAQLDSGHFVGHEGVYFAFLCAACRVSATVYQQT